MDSIPTYVTSFKSINSLWQFVLNEAKPSSKQRQKNNRRINRLNYVRLKWKSTLSIILQCTPQKDSRPSPAHHTISVIAVNINVVDKREESNILIDEVLYSFHKNSSKCHASRQSSPSQHQGLVFPSPSPKIKTNIQVT